jgi:hypothetical protein
MIKKERINANYLYKLVRSNYLDYEEIEKIFSDELDSQSSNPIPKDSLL